MRRFVAIVVGFIMAGLILVVVLARLQSRIGSTMQASSATSMQAHISTIVEDRPTGPARVIRRTSLQAASAPSPATTGAQRTVVVRFNFTDDRSEPYSDLLVASVMAQVDAFYRENSYGAAWLTTTVTPWLTPNITKDSCANLGYWAWTTAAGFDMSGYDRAIYLFPPDTNCGFLGASSVGEPPVFLNGTLDPHVIAHEMGHSFGLYHSHGGYCEDPYGCWSGEYDDIYDTMGSGRPLPPFNAFQKERLGWLGGKGKGPNLRTITKSGTYRLAAYEQPAGNPKALFWRSPAESFSHGGMGVYVEYRPEIGILIHTGGEIRYGSPTPDDSILRDLDPGPATDYVLDVGQSYAGVAGLTVTAVSPSSVQATLN